MEPVFGIISWFPDDEAKRSARLRRLNFTIRQLQTYWPTVDILILAQNWKDTKPHYIYPEKVKEIHVEGRPGILGARTRLREEFLKLDYQWMIMTDDDIILKVQSQEVADEVLRRIYVHPNGFAFVKTAGGDKWYPQIPYKSAALNFGVVSKTIYMQEGWHHYNIETGVGCEDVIFPYLLHCKYADLEFDLPEGFTHVQNEYNPDNMPSTWVPVPLDERKALAQKLHKNTGDVVDYITKHHELPCQLSWTRAQRYER